MAEIAQTYVHLRPYELNRERIDRLGYAVQESAVEAARIVYGGGVDIEVELEAGSVKGWITVGGILGALHLGYGAVADYKGFKESIVEMCEDAKKFGMIVSEAFTSKAGVSPESVYRVEKRLKVPGKIKRVFTKMEVLDQVAGSLNKSELIARMAEIEHDLQSIEKELSAEEKVGLYQMALHFENLPLFKTPLRKKFVLDVTKVALPTPRMVMGAKYPLIPSLDVGHTMSGVAIEPSVPALSFRSSVSVPKERRGPQWPPMMI